MKSLPTRSTVGILILNFCRCFAVIWFAAALIMAQSTDQSRPTPVSSNEISGTIPARSIGDSRLTNYFYLFSGNTGDVFVNVVTNNLDGDIDIFTLEGLRPLTKITIYSDVGERETGRVVYLRRFETLLLRVQGRSPNDDSATFSIKFAGSFEPVENTGFAGDSDLPDVRRAERGEVRVNSVGAIIKPETKPVAPPAEVPVLAESRSPERAVKEINVTNVDEPTVGDDVTRIEISRTPVSDPVTGGAQVPQSKTLTIINDSPLEEDVAGVLPVEPGVEEPPAEAAASPEVLSSVRVIEPLTASQLSGIDLVIVFRDGTVLKRPLNNVFNFNVHQGVLRVVTSGGTVYKYSMLDVAKVSIESNSQP